MLPTRGTLELCSRGRLSTLIEEPFARRSRHPNYAAELVFNGALAFAAVAQARTWHAAWLGALAPLGMVSTVRLATESLDARQQLRYGKDPNYIEYANWRGIQASR